MNIPFTRLQQQHLLHPKFETATDLLRTMGPVQAQDFPMAKLALGLRTNGLIEADVDREFNEGKILRTHLMRPTWHFVAAEDIHWLLDLTAPRIKVGTKGRQAQLGLTDEVFHRCYGILERKLSGNRHLTREAITQLFEEDGITCNSQWAYHILFKAELEMLICSGALEGSHQTYALLDERVKNPVRKTKDEALAELAYRYIQTRGPVTVADFVWWSGLPTADARHAFEMNKQHVVSEKIEGQIYWFPDIAIESASTPTLLLPAFDEYLICYQNRKACIAAEISPKAISSNGVFRPIVVQNGQVTAIWSRKKTPKGIVLDIQKLSNFTDAELVSEIARLERFWGKKIHFLPK